MHDANYWIKTLDLKPHPEGGYYKETYRSNIKVGARELPVGYDAERRLVTSIYYLLKAGQVSRFHRLKSDEIWYFHLGATVKIVMIDPDGHKHTQYIGKNLDKADKLQCLIPANHLFAAELIGKEEFGLFGCVVSPGFEFTDYEQFESDDLMQIYPKHSDLIKKYCP